MTDQVHAVTEQQNTKPLQFKTFKNNQEFVKWQDGIAAKIHQVTPLVVGQKPPVLTIVYQEIS